MTARPRSRFGVFWCFRLEAVHACAAAGAPRTSARAPASRDFFRSPPVLTEIVHVGTTCSACIPGRSVAHLDVLGAEAPTDLAELEPGEIADLSALVVKVVHKRKFDAAVPDEVREAASLAGVGAGIVTLLRGTAHHVGSSTCRAARWRPRARTCTTWRWPRRAGTAAAASTRTTARRRSRAWKAVVAEMAGVARERTRNHRRLHVPLRLAARLVQYEKMFSQEYSISYHFLFDASYSFEV